MPERRESSLRRGIRALRVKAKIGVGVLRRPFGRYAHVVGVTGSSGKGTVTRLVALILATQGRTYCGYNLNTFDSIRRWYGRAPLGIRLWVQEISGHIPGEVARSAAFVRPTIGIVTMVRDEHGKAFRGVEDLARSKGDLIASLPETGVAVLNADEPLVRAMADRTRGTVLLYGRAEDADIRIVAETGTLPETLTVTLAQGVEHVTIATRFAGPRWSAHVAAAVAGGRAAGVSLADCAAALQGAGPDLYRDSVHRLADGRTMVMDCYKAAFWTIESSLALLSQANATRRTVVIGTLSDYRGSSRPRYSEAARAALLAADRVIFFGPNCYRVRRLVDGAEGRLLMIETYQALSDHLHDTALPGEVIYLKASSVDHLERLVFEQRKPVLCKLDACGQKGRSCHTCKRLYGRRLSPADVAALW